jgi:GT2 family glycosyltransferase
MNPEDVTLCIPCYNVTEFLPQTLNAIKSLNPKPERVVCIDDGSKDNLGKLLNKYQWVELVTHNHNRGLAAARNTALEITETDGLAMIDADVVVKPDWLEKLLSAINAHDAAAVGGRLDEQITTWADQWRAYHMQQHFGEKSQSRDWIPGANVLYEVDALHTINGWDEQYRTNHEDVDICERLTNSGFKIWYEPEAKAVHHRTDSVYSVLAASWAWTYRYRDEPKNSLELPMRAIEHIRRTGGEVFTDIKKGTWKLAPISLFRPLVYVIEDVKHLPSKQDN